MMPAFVALAAFAFTLRPGWHVATRALLLVTAAICIGSVVFPTAEWLTYGSWGFLAAATAAVLTDALRRARRAGDG